MSPTLISANRLMSGPATTCTNVPSGFLSVTVRLPASIASTVAVSVLISELTVLVWAMAECAMDASTAPATIPTTARFICPSKVRPDDARTLQ